MFRKSRSRKSSRISRQSRRQRTARQLDSLESRLLLTVSAQVTRDGVLDITLDSDKDSAELSVAGSELQVQSDGGTATFQFGTFTAIRVDGTSGEQQSIVFTDDVSLSRFLEVTGVEAVSFQDGVYRVNDVSVVAPGTIELSGFSMVSEGRLSLQADQTLTETESGVAGFAGVVIDARSRVDILDSELTATDIDVRARLELTADADGDDSEDTSRDFARIRTEGSASVTVAGRSRFTSSDGISIQANSLQTITAQALAKPTGNDATRDAAFALTNITSTATVELGGDAAISAGGEFRFLASNTVTQTTTADGAVAAEGGKGATVALASLTSVTDALIGGQSDITAASITVEATSTATVTTTTSSTSGGATENDDQTESELAGSGATTSGGELGLAGTFARTVTDQRTTARLEENAVLTSTGDLTVRADANGTITTTADATAANNQGDDGDGVGVAIAIERSDLRNAATLGGRTSIRAPRVNVSATTSGDESHTTTATSGAGGSDLGLAGSFAKTTVNRTTSAETLAGSAITAPGASLTLAADSAPVITTEARPAGTSSVTAKKGLGASIAISRLVNQTTAAAGDNSQLEGVDNLTLAATAAETVTTTAVTGAEGGSAFTPGVALAHVDSATSAALRPGSTIQTTGDIRLSAIRSGDVTTTVAGNVLAGKTAVGGSFALNDITASADASLDRAITSGGALQLAATIGGSITASATASAEGTGEEAKEADTEISEQQNAAGSDQSAPEARAQGKVSAGAAIAVNLVDASASAAMAAGIRVTAGGAASLQASNSVDSIVTADASAVGTGEEDEDGNQTGGTKRGVGIAVAVNKASTVAEAAIREAASVSAVGLTVRANSSVGDDASHAFTTSATSGAGGRETGFAGSFALNVIDDQSLAHVLSGTVVDAGTGVISIEADNTASSDVSAKPSVAATGETRGVGISFALNVAESTVRSEIAEGAQVSAAEGLAAGTTGLQMKTNSTQTATTQAEGGAGAETNTGEKASTPVFAISAVRNQVDATLNGSTHSSGGDVLVVSTLAAAETTSADASAVATERATGIALALALSSHEVRSGIAGTAESGGSVTVTSNGTVTQSVNSKASSQGGDKDANGKTSDEATSDARSSAGAAGADAAQDAPDSKQIKTPDGSVSLAGALAVNLSRITIDAAVADEAIVTASGTLNVGSVSAVTTSVKADATAVTVAAENAPPTEDSSERGLGIAAALNVIEARTTASIGSGATIGAQGINVSAGTGAAGAHSFTTEAVSGAGGGEVGTAGSVAISVVRNTSDARILAGADVDAGDASLTIAATNTSTHDVSATPSSSATGSKKGRGASFALNVGRNSALAEVEDDVLVRDAADPSASGATSVAVTATGNHTTTTEAKGGAGAETESGEKAVTPVFAITSARNVTSARLSGSSAASHTAGAIQVSATHTGATTTTAEGNAAATETATGIVLGLGISSDETTAALNGHWQSGSDVSVTATSSVTDAATAKASSKGGQSNAAAGDADSKVAGAKKEARDADGQVIDDETPLNKTPDGSLSAAGAVAITVGRVTTTAVVQQESEINATGAMTVQALSQAEVSASADASATVLPATEDNTAQNADGSDPDIAIDPSQTGLGIAVAINVGRVTTDALIEGNVELTAASLAIDAGTAVDGSADHDFSADAVSGAGVDKVGVAGALAVNFVRNESQARIFSNTTLALTGSADAETPSGRDLSLSSRNDVNNRAEAKASVTGNPTKGVGPSIAANVADNTSRAEMANSVGFDSDIDAFTVRADGDYDMDTTSTAGSQAKANLKGDGGVAVSASAAVSLHLNTTEALAAGELGLQITGDLTVEANHRSDTDTEAGSDAVAQGKAAVGVSLAGNFVIDRTTAQAGGAFDVAGNIRTHAISDTSVTSFADATVAGAKAQDEEDDAKSLKERGLDYLKDIRKDVVEDGESVKDSLTTAFNDARDKVKAEINADVETDGFAASIAGNFVRNETSASTNGSIAAAGDVSIVAEADRDADAEANSLAASPNLENATGAAAAFNVARLQTEASAKGLFLSGRTIDIRASGAEDNTHELRTRALAGGGAKEEGKAGSVVFTQAVDSVRAVVGEGTNVTAAGALEVTADSDIELQNVAGAATLGLDEGNGGSLAVSSIHSTTAAAIEDGGFITAVGHLTVRAHSNIAPTEGDVPLNPMTVAAAGSLAGDSTRAGAAAINVIRQDTSASVGNLSDITVTAAPGSRGIGLQAGRMIVDADATTQVRTGAGALALTMDVGRGIGIAANIITKTTTAQIGFGTSITTDEQLNVTASASEDVFSIAAAPSFGGSSTAPAFGGALQLSALNVTTEATIGEGATTSSVGQTRVAADHVLDGEFVAGALSGGTNNAVAGSLTILSTQNRTDASIAEDATVAATGSAGIVVEADSAEDVVQLAAGGAGGGGTGKAGTVTLSLLHQTTRAHVDAGATISAVATGIASPGIRVDADAVTGFATGAGVLTGAGKSGYGGSADLASLQKSTSAFVSEGATLTADGNISVNATSSDDILSVAATIGGAGNQAIVGALAGHFADITTRAVLGDNPLDAEAPLTPANVQAGGSVVVAADSRTEVDFVTGGAAGGGSTAVGGAASLHLLRRNTEALIAPTTIVEAASSPDVGDVTAPTGVFDISFGSEPFDPQGVRPPALGQSNRDRDGDGLSDLNDPGLTQQRLAELQTSPFRGVSVTATGRDDVAVIAVGAAGSGGLAVGVATPFAVLRAATHAEIGDGATVTAASSSSTDAPSVRVAAGSDYAFLGIAGAGAGAGTTAVGPAAQLNSVQLNTLARIGESASVTADGDVAVQATAAEDILAITAGAAISGGFSGAGSVGFLGLNNTTDASIAAGADVDAGGNVVVRAADSSDIDVIAGAAAFGSGTGISASVAVSLIHKDTQAFIANDAEVDAAGRTSAVPVQNSVVNGGITGTTARGVIIDAQSQEDLLFLSAAGAGSLGVSGAGAINVSVIDSDTAAYIGERAQVNQNSSNPNSAQSVNVVAGNELEAKSIAGSVTLGSVAISGSVDIGAIRNDTTAFVSGEAQVAAAGDILVKALEAAETKSFGIGGSASVAGGFAGSVSVWSFGARFDASYADDTNSSNALDEDAGTPLNESAADSAADNAQILSTQFNAFSGANQPPAAGSPTLDQRLGVFLNEGITLIDETAVTSDEITTELYDTGDSTGTTATVHSDAELQAGDDIAVIALSDVDMAQVTGTLTGSLTIAGGGSVTVGRLRAHTDAMMNGTVPGADDVTVSSELTGESNGTAFSGQGGIAALGAVVTSLKDTSRVTAALGSSADIQQAGDVVVDSTSSVRLDGQSLQGAVGGVAVGAAFSRAVGEGFTQAQVADGASIGQVPGLTVQSLSVAASGSTNTKTFATAMSGGLFAAGGVNFATADTSPAVTALVGSTTTAASGAQVAVTGAVDVAAESIANADADVIGVALSAGGAIGISRARGFVTPDVAAGVGRNSALNAGSGITVSAGHNRPEGTTVEPGALANAVSAAGAAIAGNLGVAVTESSAHVSGVIHPGASLTSGGVVLVAADSTNRAESTGRGLTGSVVGVGGINTRTDIAGIASAGLHTGAAISAQSVIVRSTSDDHAVSSARAAAGGILGSGSGTSATSVIAQGTILESDSTKGGLEEVVKPNSSVFVRGAEIDAAGNVTLQATQNAEADAFSRGITISGLLSAGRSEAFSDVEAAVSTTVDPATVIDAGGSVLIESEFGESADDVVARNILETANSALPDRTHALARDGVSTAFAKASGGALVGLIGSTAETEVHPFVTTRIGSSTTIEAERIDVESEAKSHGAAVARNLSIGIVARGSAAATLDMRNDVRTVIDGTVEVDRTQLTARQNLTVRSDSTQDGDAFANSEAFAGFPGAEATATMLGTFEVHAGVGNHVDLSAGNVLTLESEVDLAEFGSREVEIERSDSEDGEELGANSDANSGGLNLAVQSTAVSRLGSTAAPALSTTLVGDDAVLSAPIVGIRSITNDIKLKADANGRGAGGRVRVEADARTEARSETRVTLASGSEILGNDITIESLHGQNSGRGLETDVEATADKDAALGKPFALATNIQDTLSKVIGAEEARITTRNLNVTADAHAQRFNVDTLENGLIFDDSGQQVRSLLHERRIEWDADIVLISGPSPELIIESDGAAGAVVTKAVGVTITDHDAGTLGPVASSTIAVNAISNTAPFGTVNFLVPVLTSFGNNSDGVITGDLGRYFVDRTFDFVKIENHSAKALEIGNISVISTRQPNVNLDAEVTTISFDVFNQFGPAAIDIRNSAKTATPPVVLNGLISNPVGSTTISSAGSVLQTGTARIVTNQLAVAATGGSIGFKDDPLTVDLVASEGRPEQLTATAAQAIELDLTGRQRRDNPAAQPFEFHAAVIDAGSGAAVTLHTSVRETDPSNPPFLRVVEPHENDVTFVLAHFETVEEFPFIDLGVLGTGAEPVDSVWNFSLIEGTSIHVALADEDFGGPLTHIDAGTNISGSAGSINSTTNGSITITELQGSLNAGLIHSSEGNVTLLSPAAIIDPVADSAADVRGQHVTLNAATTIGTAAARLQVDSLSLLTASAQGNIFLSETSGDMNVDLVQSSAGDVDLLAEKGSIVDAFGDAAADVAGNSLTLDAMGGSVGTSLPLGINTGLGGVLLVSADQGIFVTEATGGLTVSGATTALGEIRIHVPDTAASGENLTISGAQIVAPEGPVQLNAGDDFLSDASTLVQGTVVGVVADFLDADPGIGATLSISGTWIGRPVTFSSGADIDTIRLLQTQLQGTVAVNAGSDSDLIELVQLAALVTTNNGVRDRLTINPGFGDDTIRVVLSASGDFIADINDSTRPDFKTLIVAGTPGNDLLSLNAQQLFAVHNAGTPTLEAINLNGAIDRIGITTGKGNDVFAVSLAAGEPEFDGGVEFDGGGDNDHVLFAGSVAANAFTLEATSSTSAAVTTANGGQPSSPYLLSGIETLAFNGDAPTSSPGDTLHIVNAIAGIPALPSGSLTTPLPVVYTNIEGVTIGDVPAATGDKASTSEDTPVTVFAFNNDSGLGDGPLTVTVTQPSLGSVIHQNNGTPDDASDDRFVFTPAKNVSGVTSFQYTVRDINGEQSSATVVLTIVAVADPPVATAKDAEGGEGTLIPLSLSAALADTDGSEELTILLQDVPDGIEFFDSDGERSGVNRGDGVWQFTESELSRLHLLARDNVTLKLRLQATATEKSLRSGGTATTEVSFTVEVMNTAPDATIQSAPDEGFVSKEQLVRMAAQDPSSVDQGSGFLYRVTWGDGSEPQFVQGVPFSPPTVGHVYTQPGLYTVTVVAIDKDGGASDPITHLIRISYSQLRQDPLHPGQTALYVQGTDANDVILLVPRDQDGQRHIDVLVNGVDAGRFLDSLSRIVVNAGSGNDVVQMFPGSEISVWAFGESGNDWLGGGHGHDILVGGDGHDILSGGRRDDILIGGRGSDLIEGGRDENILIAGWTRFDTDEPSLLAIQREWTSNISLKRRRDHLRGTRTGGQNDNVLLLGSGPDQTVFDDGDTDLLLNDRTTDWVFANFDAGRPDLFGPADLFDEID